jgi:rubredoxin
MDHNNIPESLLRQPYDEEERIRVQQWISQSIPLLGVPGLDGPWEPQTKQLAAQLGATGFDLNRWWLITPPEWKCPCCHRDKSAIARLNKHAQLMGHLVEHHDHMEDEVKRIYTDVISKKQWPDADEKGREFAKRVKGIVAAFEHAIICQDCNNADRNAKKAVGAAFAFSFSPLELEQIVRIPPDDIDVSEAQKIWKAHERAFAMRLKIIRRICEIALVNEHWYQKMSIGNTPEVIERDAERRISMAGYELQSLSLLTYIKLFTERPKNANPVDRWQRRKVSNLGREPTENELQLVKIRNKVHWDAVPDDWSCPCCERSKRQVVQPSNDQKFSFILHQSRWYGGNEGTYICNECKITLEGISKHADVDKAQVTYQDMRELVIVVPNGSHRPKKREVIDEKIEEISMRYLLE